VEKRPSFFSVIYLAAKDFRRRFITMFKKILTFLVVLALVFSLVACSDPKQPETSPSVSQSVNNGEKKPDKSTEPKQSEPAPEPSETQKPLTPDPEPGIPAPDGWPKDIPTPTDGEIIGGGWAPDKSFYTTDIIYKQADIDAYGERLESYGFGKQAQHKYGEDWPDATVYSNGRWDVIVAEENETFDYSYVNFYPLFDVVADGYDGQPEGWPDTGGFY
jgi:hypothetical protein